MHKYFKSDWIQRNNKDSKEDKSRNVPELFSKYAMSFLCRKTWNKISVTYAFNNQSAIWKKNWNEHSGVHHGKIPYRRDLEWTFVRLYAGHYGCRAPCLLFGLEGAGRWTFFHSKYLIINLFHEQILKDNFIFKHNITILQILIWSLEQQKVPFQAF